MSLHSRTFPRDSMVGQLLDIYRRLHLLYNNDTMVHTEFPLTTQGLQSLHAKPDIQKYMILQEGLLRNHYYILTHSVTIFL